MYDVNNPQTWILIWADFLLEGAELVHYLFYREKIKRMFSLNFLWKRNLV